MLLICLQKPQERQAHSTPPAAPTPNDLAYKSQIALQKGDRTTAYNLDNLLDQQPGGEAQLIASDEVWQIATFAALYTKKISKSLPSQRSGAEERRKKKNLQEKALLESL